MINKIKRPTLSQFLAAALVIERVHNFFSETFPSYSAFASNSLRKVKKKLKLTCSLYDEVTGYLRSTNIRQGEKSTKNTIQDPILGAYLAENIEVERVICPTSGTTIDISSLQSLEMIERSQYADVDTDIIIGQRAFGPEFLAESEKNSVKTIWPHMVTFGKYNGHPIIMKIRDEDYEKSANTLDYLFAEDDAEVFDDLLRGLSKKINTECTAKGWVITCENGDAGTEFNFHEDACRELRIDNKEIDLELYDPEVQNLITRDIGGFIRIQDNFCDSGYDGRRAYMLEGPPGTGKSNIIKAIIGSLPKNYTTIVLDHKNIDRLAKLQSFPFLFPALIVIEDIDLLLGTTKHRRQVLLNFLDGLNAPRQMITVMTSNNPNALTQDITDRPGRVDRTIHVGAGNEIQRKAQLRALTRGIAIPPDVSLDALAARTEGYTVAKLRELIRRSAIYTNNFEGTISYEAIKIVLSEFDRQKSQERTKPEVEPLEDDGDDEDHDHAVWKDLRKNIIISSVEGKRNI